MPVASPAPFAKAMDQLSVEIEKLISSPTVKEIEIDQSIVNRLDYLIKAYDVQFSHFRLHNESTAKEPSNHNNNNIASKSVRNLSEYRKMLRVYQKALAKIQLKPVRPSAQVDPIVSIAHSTRNDDLADQQSNEPSAQLSIDLSQQDNDPTHSDIVEFDTQEQEHIDIIVHQALSTPIETPVKPTQVKNKWCTRKSQLIIGLAGLAASGFFIGLLYI